ncbi:hypothetical protein WR25_07668 [Diploscapter pachys]|uniref:Uncharacterized protein n=1 Tax=Diploscapter pachys TaxID=2018661 RepID=A0A2A2M4R2_9BILA|nr:hypothetical protein WR25_07668 [Diploscapter pachys]
MRVEQFHLFAADDRDAGNRPAAEDGRDLIGQMDDLDRLMDRIGDLGRTIGQAQHGYFASVAERGDRLQGDERPADRQPQLARGPADRIDRHRLDAVDRRERHHAALAVQILEQQGRNGVRARLFDRPAMVAIPDPSRSSIGWPESGSVWPAYRPVAITAGAAGLTTRSSVSIT